MNGKNDKKAGNAPAASRWQIFSADYSLFAICYSLRRGQILIPSLLVIPSLLLFVYLIFETTKISREKIRQQFAVDSAAFIQMGDYTNLLNRTAYVNGAFPYRIFKEAYECPPTSNGGADFLQKTDGNGQECPYDMLYSAGAFPKYKNDVARSEAVNLSKIPKWEIEFETKQEHDGKPRPNMNSNSPQPETELTLVTKEQATKVYVFWGDPTNPKDAGGVTGVYRFYAQVYTLLGSVEESQKTVFERLTGKFNFFRKSYYLNANTPECVSNPNICGEDGLTHGYTANKSAFKVIMHYVKKIGFYAKVPQPGLPPYYIGKTEPYMTMPDPGLFQLATVDQNPLSTLGNGYDVFQGWEAPKNYFNVDLNSLVTCRETSGRPCVHARVASQCPDLRNGNNCVWPAPTPKYQTRLYP